MAENKPEFDLAEVLNTFVKEALEDFPELKNELVIYHSGTLYGRFDADQKEALLKIGACSKSAATATAFHARRSGHGHFVINVRRAHSELFRLQGTLRHELGHLVAPRGSFEGMHGSNFKECIADAFSVLHQLQGNDAIRKRIEYRNKSAAVCLVKKDDWTHFSSPVLKELNRLSEAYNLPDMKLTPVQTANLAYRLALLYAPARGIVFSVASAFRRGGPELFKGKGWDIEPYKKCACIMFEDHGHLSSLVFLAGETFLDPYLNKREDLVGWKESKFRVFDGEYWDSIREKIKERMLIERAAIHEQRFDYEARDMMALGRFDKNPDVLIDPDAYESKENMDYLHRVMKAYAVLRQPQETSRYLHMDQEQTIARARETA